MSRLLTRNVLSKSFYSFQIYKASSIQNVNKTIDTVCLNVSLNTHRPRRLYSEQGKVEEMIVGYDYVKNATSNKNIVVVDVREPEEIKEHGKIPNSINIPLGNVSTALNSISDEEFERTYGRKKPTENTEIIFYCMIGKRSGMAQQNAINIGYKNAKNYVGSWTDWANKNQ